MKSDEGIKRSAGLDRQYPQILKNQRKLYKKQYEKRDEEARKWCSGHILEIGCGEYPIFKDSVRMDIRPLDMDNFIQHDANLKFPLPSGSFDSIVGLEVIEHLWNTDGFLKECNKVLKKGGKIMLSTPNIKHWRNRINLLLGNDENFTVEEYGHIRYFSPERLKKQLEDNEFMVVGTAPMGRIPFISLCGGFIIKAVKMWDV